jgi:hypothetical protein
MSSSRRTTTKRKTDLTTDELVQHANEHRKCSCCSRPLYLLLAVLKLRFAPHQKEIIHVCADQLKESGDALLGQFLRERGSDNGTRGVKLGVYTTYDNAESAAEQFEEVYRKLEGQKDGSVPPVEDLVEVRIMRFNAEVAEEEVSPTWNGEDADQGEVRVYHNAPFEIKWRRCLEHLDCGDAKNKMLYTKRSKTEVHNRERLSWIVVNQIDYHGSTRLMELALVDDKDRALRIARSLIKEMKEEGWLGDDKLVNDPVALMPMSLDTELTADTLPALMSYDTSLKFLERLPINVEKKTTNGTK